MFTRTALALAVVLSAATGALAAPKMQNHEPPVPGATYQDWQRYYEHKYGNDWSRFRDMGNYN
jgi:hypothetical protein